MASGTNFQPVHGGAVPQDVVSGGQDRCAPQPDGASASPGADAHPLITFTGSGWDLFLLYLVNALFTVLTLGIYSFWGKAKVRRYLWKNTLVLDEPLEYTGTGGELFRSFLLAMIFVLVGSLIFSGFSAIHPLVGSVAALAVTVTLVSFAQYQALRYRFTRTRWRGIRGNMAGIAGRYAMNGFLYSLLTVITLGLCHPLAVARLTGMRTNGMYFGSRGFSFAGRAKPLFLPWLAFLLLFAAGAAVLAVAGYRSEAGMGVEEFGGAPETGATLIFVAVGLGLLAWLAFIGYQAASMRWFFGNLAYGDVRFSAKEYTTPRLLWVSVSNFLLTVVTLGIGMPWAELRALRLYLGSIRYAGDPDFSGVTQDTRPDMAHGEGLLDALDADIGF